MKYIYKPGSKLGCGQKVLVVVLACIVLVVSYPEPTTSHKFLLCMGFRSLIGVAVALLAINHHWKSKHGQ